MEGNKETTSQPKQPKQLSYEQLRDVAGQLQQQNMQLRKALNEVNYNNLFKRLDYLFKILEYAYMFNEEFVDKCVKEIETSMTIPDSEESPKDNEDDKNNPEE